MPYLAIGILLFILLKAILAVTVLVFLIPIIIGVFIIGLINAAYRSMKGTFAPVWWNITTAVVTIIATALMWNGVLVSSSNSDKLAFIILLIYGLASLFVLVFPIAVKQHKEQRSLQKRMKTSFADEYDQLIEQMWDDSSETNDNDVHIYCEVVFDDSGKSYYYRTQDTTLEVGDAVYVPYGKNAPKRIGVIIDIESFFACDVPFPIEKTKFIIGRV